MRITVLTRGGLAVHGGSYDPHTDEVIVRTRTDETLAVTIAYPTAPSAMSTSGSGITATTPSVSSSQASLTLSALQDGGYLDIEATFGGAVRVIRIRARSQTSVDRYECGSELV